MLLSSAVRRSQSLDIIEVPRTIEDRGVSRCDKLCPAIKAGTTADRHNWRVHRTIAGDCRMAARILIVEDDPIFRSVMRDNLIFEGYRVDAVADGNTALIHARTFSP